MPVTPTRKVQVSRSPVPTKSSAAHFGGLEARALTGAGQDVQRFAVSMDKIKIKKDTFLTQKAYNVANEEAMAFSTEASKRKGEAAFGVSKEAEGNLDAIRTKAMEGMDQRQQNIFTQNWEPKAIGYRQRAAQYELQQTEVAYSNEQQTLLTSETEIWSNTGDDESYDAAETAFKNILRSQGASDADIEKKMPEFRDGMAQSRFDNLLKINDFEGAKNYVGDPDTQVGKERALQMENAQLKQERLAEGAAVQKYNMGVKANTLDRMAGTDISLFTYQERLGEVRGKYEFDRQIVLDAEQERKFRDEVHVAEQNDPGTSIARNADLLQMAADFPNGNISMEEFTAAYDNAKADKSMAGGAARTMMNEAMTDYIKGTGTLATQQRVESYAAIAKEFDANKDWNNGPWLTATYGGGKANYDSDKDKITTEGEGSQILATHFTRFDAYIRQVQLEKNHPLSVEEHASAFDSFMLDYRRGVATVVARTNAIDTALVSGQGGAPVDQGAASAAFATALNELNTPKYTLELP